jgi:hypothetical protein
MRGSARRLSLNVSKTAVDGRLRRSSSVMALGAYRGRPSKDAFVALFELYFCPRYLAAWPVLLRPARLRNRLRLALPRSDVRHRPPSPSACLYIGDGGSFGRYLAARRGGIEPARRRHRVSPWTRAESMTEEFGILSGIVRERCGTAAVWCQEGQTIGRCLLPCSRPS